ncbi:MAG TPA: methionine--tRNA ligase, partial [Paracoccaceae bacterium]|nr:methionine--tRNA ligase [Paracoccaceae bacterium]
YINGIKHLGNLIGSQLPADAYARYMRARKHEVMLICATDEHGTPAELAAAKEGRAVAEYCAEMWRVQKDLADGFRLSFNWFGRSSSERNHRLTQHFAGRLADAGLIEERVERQFYSAADGRFLPDRYIEGTCPNCGYERARGDQCENCTKQLDPTDLIDPRSAISGSTGIELRDTRHLYLRQSAMRDRLRTWIDSKTDWPILSSSIARKWLDEGEGLQDRGITRDLDWGIQVRRGTEPWPGMEGKVFYVWFDAPIEYIAATAEWADADGRGDEAWERWWREDKGASDVRYVQFMGKDNVPFHTLSFPVTLMGANFDGTEPWKLVDFIKSTNWLTYEGGKFSTSQRRGVFMDQALDVLPPDYWRWWLLSNIPETADSDFTWAAFQTGVNKDLADVLGNFVSRVTKFCRSRFGEAVPEGGEYGPHEKMVIADISNGISALEQSWDRIEIRRAAAILREIWVDGNQYLQEAAPWTIWKTDPNRAAAVVRFSINLIRLYAIVSRPFIPDASDTMLQALGIKDEKQALNWPDDVAAAMEALPPRHPFTVPENLFAKIDEEQREAMASRFAGSGG